MLLIPASVKVIAATFVIWIASALVGFAPFMGWQEDNPYNDQQRCLFLTAVPPSYILFVFLGIYLPTLTSTAYLHIVMCQGKYDSYITGAYIGKWGFTVQEYCLQSRIVPLPVQSVDYINCDHHVISSLTRSSWITNARYCLQRQPWYRTDIYHYVLVLNRQAL